MSCPPELSLSVYADGELAPDAQRALEGHLIRCEVCRGRVVALREEAELLSDALLERARRTARLPARRAPARGLALGAGPAIAAAVLVAGVVSWLLESRPVPGWLDPFRLQGVPDMAFDLVFLLRDEAPGLLALAAALAATLSLSAALSFGLATLVRRWTGPGEALLLALVLLAAPAPSRAHFGLHDHEDYDLPAGATHEGTLLLSGETVNVDGVVDGDLIVAARRLALRGEVRGNLFAFVATADIAGTVRGSAFCLCSQTRVEGRIDSDLYNLSAHFVLTRAAEVGRNATVATDDGVIEGSIGRDLVSASDRLELRGSVARHVAAWDRLWVRDSARVGGDVSIVLEGEDGLEIDPGASIGGETRRELGERLHEHHLDRYRSPAFYALHVIGMAAAMLVGILLHRLVPRIYAERLETASSFFAALGLGFVALVATPLGLAVLALTLVGIPLALIGLAVYLTALYLSGILVAALVGATLVRPEPERARSFALSLLVGVVVVAVVAHLPFVAIPVHVLVVLTGLGLIVRRATAAWARPRAAAS